MPTVRATPPAAFAVASKFPYGVVNVYVAPGHRPEVTLNRTRPNVVCCPGSATPLAKEPSSASRSMAVPGSLPSQPGVLTTSESASE